MSWTEGSVEVDGVEIHYVRTGAGDKPPALLLHGFTDNGRCWTRVAEAIEPTLDVVMIDQRNHGASGAAAGTCADMADDAATVINQLAIGPTVVVGHSLGAATAAELGVRHPGLTHRIVLEDPPWRRPASVSASPSPKGADARRNGLQAFVDSFAGMSVEAIEAMGRAQHPLWHDDDFPAWATAKLQIRPEAIESITPQPWDQLVAQLQCPTLLIHGDAELGGVVTEDVAAHIEALNPLISTAAVEGAGHNVRREKFEAYLGVLEPFIAGG